MALQQRWDGAARPRRRAGAAVAGVGVGPTLARAPESSRPTRNVARSWRAGERCEVGHMVQMRPLDIEVSVHPRVVLRPHAWQPMLKLTDPPAPVPIHLPPEARHIGPPEEDR